MSKKHPPKQPSPAKRSAILYLRVFGAFILLGVLAAVLYWWGYHSYPDVAEWAEPGSHDALVYQGETYYLSGQIGKNGLTKSKYPIDELLGQIKEEESPATTEPETTAETEPATEDIETEDESEGETETEIESVIPPAGAEFFQDDKHTYILYSVEKNENFLILSEKDGKQYLYYKEGTPNPSDSK